MTAPLPDLPPGWEWRRDGGTVDLRAGGVLWSWYLADSGSVDDAADNAHDITDALLCAAIEAIATDAGVVLPDDYDPAAVLRDGVRAQVRA